jgi:hypothetical protein
MMKKFFAAREMFPTSGSGSHMFSVIASEAKQSTLPQRKKFGLLRRLRSSQ